MNARLAAFVVYLFLPLAVHAQAPPSAPATKAPPGAQIQADRDQFNKDREALKGDRAAIKEHREELKTDRRTGSSAPRIEADKVKPRAGQKSEKDAAKK